MRNSKVAGLASIVLLAVLVGVSSPAQAGQGSATTSSSDTSKHPSCNGQAIDLTAPVISRHDVLIMAPVAKVWAAHIDLAAWPSWNRHVAYIKRLDDGPLRVGSRFEWKNGAFDIVSVVHAITPQVCTLWGGESGGIEGIHLWTFTKAGGNTLVHTEESWSGTPVTQDPKKAQALLDTGLTDGAEDLKTFVENGNR